MKPFRQTCKPFLEHLQYCGGCSGKRDIKHCKFALECQATEILVRRGEVTNQEELLLYSANSCDIHWFMLKKCNCSNIATNSLGPCENESN